MGASRANNPRSRWLPASFPGRQALAGYAHVFENLHRIALSCWMIGAEGGWLTASGFLGLQMP